MVFVNLNIFICVARYIRERGVGTSWCRYGGLRRMRWFEIVATTAMHASHDIELTFPPPVDGFFEPHLKFHPNVVPRCGTLKCGLPQAPVQLKLRLLFPLFCTQFAPFASSWRVYFLFISLDSPTCLYMLQNLRDSGEIKRFRVRIWFPGSDLSYRN